MAAATLLEHHTYYIHILSHLLLWVGKQESSLYMLIIAPDLDKGFSCSFFRFLVGSVDVFLILGCLACVSELTTVLIRQRTDGRALGLTLMTNTD